MSLTVYNDILAVQNLFYELGIFVSSKADSGCRSIFGISLDSYNRKAKRNVIELAVNLRDIENIGEVLLFAHT